MYHFEIFGMNRPGIEIKSPESFVKEVFFFF